MPGGQGAQAASGPIGWSQRPARQPLYPSECKEAHRSAKGVSVVRPKRPTVPGGARLVSHKRAHWKAKGLWVASVPTCRPADPWQSRWPNSFSWDPQMAKGPNRLAKRVRRGGVRTATRANWTSIGAHRLVNTAIVVQQKGPDRQPSAPEQPKGHIQQPRGPIGRTGDPMGPKVWPKREPRDSQEGLLRSQEAFDR